MNKAEKEDGKEGEEGRENEMRRDDGKRKGGRMERGRKGVEKRTDEERQLKCQETEVKRVKNGPKNGSIFRVIFTSLFTDL